MLLTLCAWDCAVLACAGPGPHTPSAVRRRGGAGSRAGGRADRLVFGGPDFRRGIEAARDDGASLTWVAAAPISIGALGLWLTLDSATAAKAATQCEQIWLRGAANGVVRESGRYTPLRNADWQTEREIASVRSGTR